MEGFLRIDMTNRTATFEPVPDKYKGRAGRWLTSSIVHDEVPATCHPLGPNNKLVFSPGIVTGTASPTSSRISVGGKSPLTGGIKEANAGTGLGGRLARLGIRAIIVEGQADGFWLLKIDKDGATFEAADSWTGEKLSEVYPELFDRSGGQTAVDICSIGIAGENRMLLRESASTIRTAAPAAMPGAAALGPCWVARG